MGTAYVANTGESHSSISVIDTTTCKLKTSIPTSRGQSYLACRVVNNQLWYILNSGQVGVACLGSHKEIAVLDMPHTATAVTVTPDGLRAYVAGWSDYGDGFAGHIWIVNTVTKKIIGTIWLDFGLPTDIAISPDNKWIYVSSGYDFQVVIINRLTRQVTNRIPTEAPALYIAMSAARNRAYVSYDNGVLAIDLAKQKQVDNKAMLAYNLAVTPDQKYLYVNQSGRFAVISLATNVVIKRFRCLGDPRGLAMTPDNHYVYIAQYGKNRIAVYNRRTGYFVKTIAAGVNPVDVTITR